MNESLHDGELATGVSDDVVVKAYGFLFISGNKSRLDGLAESLGSVTKKEVHPKAGQWL